MACNAELLNGGISLGCESNTGGIKKIYIADAISVSGFQESCTGITSGTCEIITGLTLNPNTFFYNFDFNKNTSTYTETATVNLEAGTTFYTQTITLVIPRREQAKRNKLLLLAAAQKRLYIIVQDSNGLYWFFGQSEGCVLTGNEGGAGITKTDFNGYTITFTAEEPYLAKEVDPALIPTIISI